MMHFQRMLWSSSSNAFAGQTLGRARSSLVHLCSAVQCCRRQSGGETITREPMTLNSCLRNSSGPRERVTSSIWRKSIAATGGRWASVTPWHDPLPLRAH